MTTKSKSNEALAQLTKGLMDRHSTSTASPAAEPSVARPSIVLPSPQTGATAPSQPPPAQQKRISVQLLAGELARLEAVILEVHQRLGVRIGISDVLRIGFMRIGPDAPITTQELALGKSMDRRRFKDNWGRQNMNR